MSKVLWLVGSFMLCMLQLLHAQTDTLKEQTMEEIILSVNKWEQKLNEVPNKIIKINKENILRGNPQTSADLLSQTGNVFIQKSQLGGGSPMIRGFATNRVLLVVDGVRMNNAIYRSGNLQNVISIDALSTQTAEVIFGPGSIIYGSDAIGGVMDFHTLQAALGSGKKLLVRGSGLVRYATANQEKTTHVDLNIGGSKLSFLSAITFSDFDDLKMGKNGGQESYLRPEYVQRISNSDSIVSNADPQVQKFSGYNQLNLLQKLRYRPTASLELTYSFIHAKTGEAPRYDRLIQYRNNKLRFAEWNYGPMTWNMHLLQAIVSKKNRLWDYVKAALAYQDYKESRIDRPRGSSNRTTQTEAVDAFNANIDAVKQSGKAEFFYGAEYVYNKVNSAGIREDIINNTVIPFISRYPNGSNWASGGIYGSYKINFHPKFTFTTGARYSYNSLKATFDTAFIKFPYQETALQKGALTGSAGLVFRPDESWQFNGNIATGYRMPNIDDIGKFFESTPGNITVPNPGLQPEYAWNFEIGVIKEVVQKFRFEINAFHTLLTRAIVRRPFLLNGNDSIHFDGTKSRVEALQNVARATVWGLQSSARFYINNSLFLQSHANWTNGKETDDEKNEQVPLRHAPPFYGSTHLHFENSILHLEVYSVYNSEISNKKLAPSEQDKADIYAKDQNGLPYSPAWHTLNFRTSCRATKNITLTANWENITNRRYRPYSSGIVAAGSNLIFSFRYAF